MAICKKKKKKQKQIESVFSPQNQVNKSKEKQRDPLLLKWEVRLWLEVKWVFTGAEWAQLFALMEQTADGGDGKWDGWKLAFGRCAANALF